MRLFSFFAIAFVSLCLITNSFAAKIYHRVPFTADISSHDILVVDYDFSQKNGVQCSANSGSFKVDFTYKGRDKTASLPVLLQSSHVPKHDNEELADNSGQFSITLGKKSSKNQIFSVSCHYAPGD